jgi:4-hydroxy-2-oxoheptanedioate aldolase
MAEKGGLQPDTMPFVRIPPNAREMNLWIIKQALDTGVYGIITPHVDTVEQAMAAVSACRYAQAAGAPDARPAGARGYWYRLAPRYWGLSMDEYYQAADLWPLDPAGELFYMPLIEGVEGVRNLDAILTQVKGISAIWAGPADLSVEMGLKGNTDNPAVEDSVEHIVSTCRMHNIPCAIFAGPNDVQKRIDQGFRIIISGPARVDRAMEIGKKAAGR